jgi:hypothetical protein
MQLDLRIPMGLLFTLVGVILAAFGAATNSDPAQFSHLYAKSLGINVNLWWGLVLLVFGQVMFQMGRRSQRRLEKTPPAPKASDSPRRGH